MKKKVLSGVFWTFIDSFIIKGFFFISMLLLARWLGPREFGLIGMISVFIGIGTSLVDSGMSSSLIRSKFVDQDDFSTVFIANLLLSFFVYLILFFLAPFIADFYKQEILISIVRVYCLIFIISAFSSVQLAIMNRGMKFKEITIINLPANIIGIIIGLILGYNEYGVWSIVIMYLVINLISLVLLFIYSKWIPTLHFSKDKFKFHYKFGYKLMLSGLLNYIFKDIYNILIGKFYSLQTLGFYERAKRFNEYPATTVTSIVGKITYPMLSSIQNDTVKLSNVTKKTLRVTFFLTAPLILGIAAIAQPMFDLILGKEWAEAVLYFQILSLASIFYPIHSLNINILKVFGRSDLFLKIEILKKIIITISVFFGFKYGVLGLVWSIVFASVIELLINIFYGGSLINYSVKNQLMDMLPTFILTILTALIMYFCVNCFSDYSNVLIITSSVIIGGFFYLSISYLHKKSPFHELIELIKKRKV